ncbi:MAG: phosphatidate cytidylyltransferase [Desulfobacteraceae bacterium]
MHLKRWLTAVVLIPLVFLVVLKGSPLLFSLLMAAATLFGMAEYFSLFAGQGELPKAFRFLAHGASLTIIAGAHAGSAQMVLLLTAMNVLALSLLVVTTFSDNFPGLDAVFKQVHGVVYIPLFLALLVFVRNSENGALWVIWLWVIIGASDTAAFYGGRLLGKHPLAVEVSPKKTIEGAVAGLAAALAVGVGFCLFFLPHISLVPAAVFALTAAASGQVGDLYESAMKRACNIKDSGSILPGHGGVLDRLDGLLFAVPVAYLFKVFLL